MIHWGGLSILHNKNKPIEICVYNSELKSLWNNFVECSRNGMFLFDRDYMEYHSDRFIDHSLLFFQDSKLLCILPANVREGTLYSHEGLTFGGIISDRQMKVSILLDVFDALSEHCKKENIKEILYKVIPHIYHSIPSEEDLYALFFHKAELVSRSVSLAICQTNVSQFESNRIRTIKKAKQNNLIVKKSLDLKFFMEMVEANLLERHNAKPTHSIKELQLLAEKFPNNIKLFASLKDDVMLAGVLIYESKNVAKVQYVATSQLGRSLGAGDIVFDFLINQHYKEKRYFDFGTSMSPQGLSLNVGLIEYKESFGARTVVYDSYKFAP